MKKILIIGGTGIIGSATVKEALKKKFAVTTVALDKNKSFPNSVTQIVQDRHDRKGFKDAIAKLNEDWDIVFDVYAYDAKDAKQTYYCFKDRAKHIFVLSTTLVYDRRKYDTKPIKTTALVAKLGTMGGYVDDKLKLEKFWRGVRDVNWTILRAYHVVGPKSLLGCIPLHNRDPKLLETIKRKRPLWLANGGEILLNIVHSKDLAKIVLKAAGNKKSYGSIYNAVNPKVIKAKQYFKIIGELLGTSVVIKNKPTGEIWREKLGWELTTLPHVYDIANLKKDIGFVPSLSIRSAIKDALAVYPKFKGTKSRIPVHKNMLKGDRPKSMKWLSEK